MNPIFIHIDPALIWFYRLTGNALVDFLTGTFVLAFLALITGEVTASFAFLAGRRYIERTSAEMVKYQNLSMDALKAGDKAAYQAANKLANDAFGRSFFMRSAMSAGYLWPAFLALAWMNYRFWDVHFVLITPRFTVGYVFMFIVLYAAAYLVFKRIKYKLPHFRRIKTILEGYRDSTEQMKTPADLLPFEARSK